jgi:alpha-N-arabinofuranosidase
VHRGWLSEKEGFRLEKEEKMIESTVRVDPQRKLGKAQPLVFGQFIEHLGRCIYGGVFEPGSRLADEQGFRKDVFESIHRLRPPILRWPGGNFA